jgi:GNAT superfamily N-acetyltransferase
MKKKKAPKKKSLKEEKNQESIIESDENFYFIAGYTPNGVPFGITWKEFEKDNLSIRNLLDYPEHLETVSSWIYEEFADKSLIKYDEIKEFFRKRFYDKLPITLIALKDEQCVGTVSLFEGDLDTRRDLKPWLAALYVDQNYRGQGIGAELINSIINKAEELGYNTLFLRTEHTSDYYKKRKWEFVCKTKDSKGIDTEVYKYEIN